MDMPAFNIDKIPLPSVARSLCREALKLAVPRLNRIEPDELDEQLAAALASMAVAFESAAEDSDETSFDASNHYAYPHDASGVVAQLQGMGISADPGSPEFEVAKSAPDENFDRSLAVVVINFVRYIKQAEDFYLQGPTVDGYQRLMEAIDPLVIGLRLVIQSFATLEPALELRTVKVSRKAGASNGGKAKAQLTNELKAIVLDEASQHIRKIPAAAVARGVYENFMRTKHKQSLLLDDKGEPLLKDPVYRFTLWIREARRVGPKK